MKRWKTNLRGFAGLDYIVFKNVPMRDSTFGEVIDCNPKVMESLAAEAIIRNRIPIRGIELRFLRNVLALSLDRLAKDLDITAAAVRKWEIKEAQRLHLINEAAVRALFAEKLGLAIDGKFSELIGTEHFPDEIVLKTS